MTYTRIGALTVILVGLHGCGPGNTMPASPPTPTSSPPEIREVENPQDRSVSLVFDPVVVSSELPGGELRIGGMYVRSGTGGPDGGAVLVLRVHRRSSSPVLNAGVRLHLEIDGIRLAASEVQPGTLHRTRRTEGGWSETLLVPVAPDALVALGRAASARLILSGGPPLAIGDELRSGLGALADRLPDRAFASTRADWKAAS